MIIELGTAFHVLGKATYFTYHLAIFGFVAVVFGASGTEFHDEVVGGQFILEITQVIAVGQMKGGLLGL